LFDALERRQQNLSFSSGPNSRRFMDYSVWRRQNTASPILSQVGLTSCRALSPGWGRANWSPSTLGYSPFGINLVAAAILEFGFCLVLVFHQETDLFHCNCDVESFCCESGPRSCSSPVWQLVLFWSELEPHACLCFYTSAISDCALIRSYLCSLIRLQGKAFLERSIELCLVDNQ
jgi:hypothetical protein